MHHPQRYLFRAAVGTTLLLGAARSAADAVDETRPLLDAVRAAVADGRLTQSNILGFTPGKEGFTESPSEPGFLTGFDLGVGKFFDIDTIYAARAVFWTSGGDEVLKDHGLFRDKLGPKNKAIKTKVLRVEHVRARPGYAVGGLTLRSGLNINGLSVTFMRIKDGKLDPRDSYESDWVGDRTGGGEAVIRGDGAPVVGIAGNQDAEKICALGLTFTTLPAPAAAPPVVAPPLVAPPVAAPPRTRPAVPPPADNPLAADPAQPQPAAADPAPESAAGPAHPTNPPAPVEKSSLDLFLAYGVPGAAFVAVTGLVLVFALTSYNRRNVPVRRPANRPRPPIRPPAVAISSPSTGLRERPSPLAAPRPAAADEDVLELGPDDFDLEVLPSEERAEAPKAAPPSDSWPQLEL